MRRNPNGWSDSVASDSNQTTDDPREARPSIAAKIKWELEPNVWRWEDIEWEVRIGSVLWHQSYSARFGDSA